MNSINSKYGCVSLLPELQQYLVASISLAALPEHSKRIALNFRHYDYHVNQTGPHPIEIHLTRLDDSHVWKITTMTSFSFPDDSSSELEVELYFNLNHQWFYQPDIERCELNRPEVIALFHSWQRALLKAFRDGDFDTFAISTIDRTPQTTV
ncbi:MULTISPECIES: DUF2787 domain-containing protein [Vibrio]|uniref:DUF2787 domain-containing protein n=1 Tax=Vibrio TaxID=662 RepID=UPI00215FBC45|nr:MULTISPECIES: DUF2787 domain-containing protein [Vibrio]MCS0183507.1 DUF2787 domain-containing protein [Vibrio alginolyticus]MDW3152614.1 DUF2787 domain-containing protein [Vibrio sp. 779(2023)]